MEHLFFIIDTFHPGKVKVTSAGAVMYKGTLLMVFKYLSHKQQFIKVIEAADDISLIVKRYLGLAVTQEGKWADAKDEAFFHLKFNDLQDTSVFIDLPENS